MTRINLGCGRDFRAGWDNIDISKEVKAEYYLDIRTDKLPHKDNSVSEIYCSGVLEQVLYNEHLVHSLNECHRVMQKEGILSIVVPNATYAICNRDPFDCRRFLPETFRYFEKGTQEYELYGSVYGFKSWSLKSLSTNERGIMSIKLQK